MIYLIFQMTVALVLAAICGAAIGWLIHRASHTRHIENLRRSMARQKNQLTQSQSEIDMLSSDYEELQRRSQDEIEGLREEAGQIPFLNTNLEKSQLLVRQMMQKHDSKLRDLNAQNQSLAAKLKNFEDRDHASNTVKTELDRVRRKSLNPTDQPDTDTETDTPSISSGAMASGALASAGVLATGTINAHSLNADDGSTHPANEYAASNDTSATLQQTDFDGDSLDELQANESAIDSLESELYEIDAAPTDAADTPQSDEISTLEDANEPQQIDDKHAVTQNDTANDQPQISDARTSGSWASAALAPNALTQSYLAPGSDDQTSDAESPDSDPFDNVMEFDDELQRELDIDADDNLLLDGSGDASNLFDPVEQQDDLKQIFGIGPVTEKALNELGITSYSQLADLKDHDIEKIAGALEIVPGRIERDDWVGNARRQLEDVLEQL